MISSTFSQITRLCIILTALFLIAGCGGGGGGGGSTPEFTLLNVVTPSGWSSQGGTVAIVAALEDNTNVAGVQAVVTKPGGIVDPNSVAMPLSGGSTYAGNYTVGPNTTNAVQIYTVVITVTRSNGSQTSSSPFAFYVPVSTGPPGPP
jgi:hypothetical protein